MTLGASLVIKPHCAVFPWQNFTSFMLSNSLHLDEATSSALTCSAGLSEKSWHLKLIYSRTWTYRNEQSSSVSVFRFSPPPPPAATHSNLSLAESKHNKLVSLMESLILSCDASDSQILGICSEKLSLRTCGQAVHILIREA